MGGNRSLSGLTDSYLYSELIDKARTKCNESCVRGFAWEMSLTVSVNPGLDGGYLFRGAPVSASAIDAQLVAAAEIHWSFPWGKPLSK